MVKRTLDKQVHDILNNAELNILCDMLDFLKEAKKDQAKQIKDLENKMVKKMLEYDSTPNIIKLITGSISNDLLIKGLKLYLGSLSYDCSQVNSSYKDLIHACIVTQNLKRQGHQIG